MKGEKPVLEEDGSPAAGGLSRKQIIQKRFY